MTIIIFLIFMFVVAAMEIAHERRYLSRFFSKAKDICIIAYASVLYWTGII